MKTLIAVLTLALAAVASPASADLPEAPIETHCVADETGAAHCSTTVAGTCAVSSVSGFPSSVSCDLPVDSAAMALPVTCSVGPLTPGGDTHCEGTVAGCGVLVHAYDEEDALNHYKVACGCVAYDNYGRPAVRFDCYSPPPLASTSTDLSAAEPCQSGFAQTWCDFAVGPCEGRLTPWTAWGDESLEADCRGGSMTRCHAEVHTQDPTNPEQWCAF
ncbi:MAG: hypothetical protein ACYC2H_02875 [Thermoplasmatota archaeon]